MRILKIAGLSLMAATTLVTATAPASAAWHKHKVCKTVWGPHHHAKRVCTWR